MDLWACGIPSIDPKQMNSIRNYTLLAATACLLGAGSANAALVSYTSGDLLMSFRATTVGSQGFGTTYVVNVGQASSFRDATSSTTLNLGNIGTDLAALFGAGWASRGDILWGVAGTPSNTATVGGDAAATLYASAEQGAAGQFGSGWEVAGSSTRTSIATNMVLGQDTFKALQSTSNSAFAALMPEAMSNDWREFLADGGNPAYTSGGKDFGAFANIEGSIGKGLNLYRMNTSAAGSYEGSFTINSAGVVNFVPEPSTAILGVLGTGLLAFRRRRRGL